MRTKRAYPLLANSLLIAALALAAVAAQATVRVWPGGVAPCDTTLQACIDGSANADTVQVQSNGPIDEDLAVNKPFNLLNAPGYRPALTAGRGISTLYNPGAGVGWSLLIEGFTIPQGNVGVRAGGAATIIVRRIDVDAVESTFAGGAIGVSNLGADAVVYDIGANRIRVSAAGVQAITIYAYSTGPTGGGIHDNRIECNPPSPSADNIDDAISISGSHLTAPKIDIYSNQISGAVSYGVTIAVGGPSNLLLANNVVRTTISGSAGTNLSASAGNTLDAQIFNNTIAGFGFGFYGYTTTSGISGRLSGNLFAYNASFAIDQQGSTLTEDHTLFFSNGGPAPTLGTGSMVADPKFARGLEDLRLTSGSPAIAAADSAALTTLLANAGLPQIDADGLRRFKGAGSLADIGAFEYGDGSLIESVTAANVGVIDSPLLNGNSAALPQLTQDKTPDTYVAALYDASLMALTYSNNRFDVIDEDNTAPTNGSVLNVFAPAPGNGVLLHTSAASNITSLSQIDDAYLNGPAGSGRIVLATQRALPVFTHPFGVAQGGFFCANHWCIDQLDGGTFQASTSFDIYAQDPSLNAFVWIAPTAGPSTAIDQVLLNGEPCGRIYVTNGISDPHPIAVAYDHDIKRWTIVNLDGQGMPAESEFYVIVDEAATQFCRYDHVFHDGLEGG